MNRRPFNVLQAPPQAAPRAPLPWLVIVATLAFLLVMGRELESLRQQLTHLRYDAAQGLDSAPAPAPDADSRSPARQALTAELTYPWDQVLNLVHEPGSPVQWTQLEARAPGEPLRLQVRAPDARTFWAWLGTLQKNSAVARATATNGQADDGRMVFEVAITWRRQP